MKYKNIKNNEMFIIVTIVGQTPGRRRKLVGKIWKFFISHCRPAQVGEVPNIIIDFKIYSLQSRE